jgi:hypothetical protein
LRKYQDILRDKQSEIETSYESAMEGFQIESDDFIDPGFYFENELSKYYDIFPKQYFNPLLISLYGFFENWLKRICDLDSKRGFSNVKVKDLAGGNYIERSRKYLSIVADLNLSESENDWQIIKKIQKVRNAIAHNDSNLIIDKNKELNQQVLYSHLKLDSRIGLNEKTGSFYIKDKEFLFEIIELIERYLTYVIDSLSSRKVVAKNTTMPFNNDTWGQEKAAYIIDCVVNCLDLIDKFNDRKDEYTEENFNADLQIELDNIMWDATKIYSFFCDSDWDEKDSALIIKERKQGFDKIKEIYRK